ncbi:glutamate-1-semialdehyde 2,1-aminomutase [Candidatus Methylomirabilis sp.]|uniref:glutamate-1-semialdehyde 2,1-aminomutase n=1 Tax=Candidatus Methylomirabilis sp. TaxID=2032687 RepID=UPI002A676E7E|nr:glutamate-1-semialdehyde 2,1-aminomutase [Candidatus Methylomirabilis sp.]
MTGLPVRQTPTGPRSKALFEEAVRLLPGGVSSPVRAFKAVGGQPVVIERAHGCRLYDVDGQSYIDYVGSWGPMIVGHAHPAVVKAIQEAAALGVSYGAPTPWETILAQMVVEAIPSIELVRFVNSGTEATMSAIRLARGVTRRDRIVKFEGCYHGHADSLLVKAGSGAMTFGVPDSLGVPPDLARLTMTLPYNNVDAVRSAFEAMGNEIACVIVEPVVGNMGVVPPKPGFLTALREMTAAHGSLLVFDEVMTGFRLGKGGAQALYGIRPDLTCLGKIIGGGLPVGAYGGPRSVMEQVAPLGPVYQAGTLSGNPLAMRAGIETLRLLDEPGFYERLETKGKQLEAGLRELAAQEGIALQCQRVGSMCTAFFTEQPVIDYQTARTADTDRYAAFFWAMLQRGVYLPPSQFEAAFLSDAHAAADIESTLLAAKDALTALRCRQH